MGSELTQPGCSREAAGLSIKIYTRAWQLRGRGKPAVCDQKPCVTNRNSSVVLLGMCIFLKNEPGRAHRRVIPPPPPPPTYYISSPAPDERGVGLRRQGAAHGAPVFQYAPDRAFKTNRPVVLRKTARRDTGEAFHASQSGSQILTIPSFSAACTAILSRVAQDAYYRSRGSPARRRSLVWQRRGTDGRVFLLRSLHACPSLAQSTAAIRCSLKWVDVCC